MKSSFLITMNPWRSAEGPDHCCNSGGCRSSHEPGRNRRQGELGWGVGRRDAWEWASGEAGESCTGNGMPSLDEKD
jgi:hypothetical protein